MVSEDHDCVSSGEVPGWSAPSSRRRQQERRRTDRPEATSAPSLARFGRPRSQAIPDIPDVLLVRQAEQEQPAPLIDWLAAGIQAHGDPVNDVFGHVVVDVVGELDEPELLPAVRFTCQDR